MLYIRHLYALFKSFQAADNMNICKQALAYVTLVHGFSACGDWKMIVVTEQKNIVLCLKK